MRAIQGGKFQRHSIHALIREVGNRDVRFKLMDDIFYLGKECIFIAVKINCELFIDKVKVRVLDIFQFAHTFLDLFRTMRTIEFFKKQSHFTHFTFSYTTKNRSLSLLADMLDTHIEYYSDVFIGN